jgi:hypothetical protein
LTAVQPPIETPIRCTLASPSPAKVSSSHCASSSGPVIALSCTDIPASPSKSTQMTERCSSMAGMLSSHIGVDALRPGSNMTGGPAEDPSNRYTRTEPNDVVTSVDSRTDDIPAMAAR